MTRSRLESLLMSFTKLIPPGVEHTTLQSPDGSVRYVYMPIDELYVCLLTPPLSNILQDIDTLHLLGRIVTEMCSVGTARGGVGEGEILRNAFELLSAFDEVVSLGYRERVGMTEVRAAMEMESHEERIQEIIARNKEHEAKEELKRRAKQLELQRREALRRGQNPYGNQKWVVLLNVQPQLCLIISAAAWAGPLPFHSRLILPRRLSSSQHTTHQPHKRKRQTNPSRRKACSSVQRARKSSKICSIRLAEKPCPRSKRGHR